MKGCEIVRWASQRVAMAPAGGQVIFVFTRVTFGPFYLDLTVQMNHLHLPGPFHSLLARASWLALPVAGARKGYERKSDHISTDESGRVMSVQCSRHVEPPSSKLAFWGPVFSLHGRTPNGTCCAAGYGFLAQNGL